MRSKSLWRSLTWWYFAGRLARRSRKDLWLPKGIVMLERLRMWYWQTLHKTVVNCVVSR